MKKSVYFLNKIIISVRFIKSSTLSPMSTNNNTTTTNNNKSHASQILASFSELLAANTGDTTVDPVEGLGKVSSINSEENINSEFIGT